MSINTDSNYSDITLSDEEYGTFNSHPLPNTEDMELELRIKECSSFPRNCAGFCLVGIGNYLILQAENLKNADSNYYLVAGIISLTGGLFLLLRSCYALCRTH